MKIKSQPDSTPRSERYFLLCGLRLASERRGKSTSIIKETGKRILTISDIKICFASFFSDELEALKL